MNIVDSLRDLYTGEHSRAQRFRFGLVAFDIATIVFVIFTSFIDRNIAVRVIDLIFGAGIVLDIGARFLIAPNRWRYLMRPITLADLISDAAFLLPMLGDQFGFLRALRMLRLLHTYQLVERIRQDHRFFRMNEEVIGAAVNLAVFLFIMTGIVYATQHTRNPDISNYADALYFTVTALTTTGFGDITLPGTLGRLIAVVIMLFGVTLFLRLAQVLFRPSKVRHRCAQCGLLLHDWDAVHCKHCGTTINIETEGGA